MKEKVTKVEFLMYTVENFILGLQKIWPHLTVEHTSEEQIKIIHEYSSWSTPATVTKETVAEISISELVERINTIPTGFVVNELFGYTSTSCEVLVQPDRLRGPTTRYLDREYYPVNSNNYSFVISKSSTAYAIAMICSLADRTDINAETLVFSRPYISGECIHTLETLFLTMRLLSLKATSPCKTSLAEFRKMAQSYLFNICYNTNAVLTIPDLHIGRREVRRSARREGQLFPYKQYNQSLVKYYYQGLSSDIPFAQYLAFYHVPEFFFQAIAEDDAFKEIEDFITHPSFSPRKKEDMRRFYNKVRKIMYSQKENDVWDEKVGFILCLKKYVPDLETLKATINTIDSSALEYYKTTSVSFADEGCIVNFASTPDDIYASIRNRVYSVRNAIVHSKEGERLKYEPFRHDKELTKEIPLIRAIAEEIIINSSKSIDIKTSTDS